MMPPCIVFFFFFQAEDGIRDLTVTGVQTCALPISAHRSGRSRPIPPGAGAPCGSSNWGYGMREQWGRKEYAGEWPKPKHGWTITTLLVATLSVAGVSAYRCAYVLTPLQQFYLKTYIRSGLRSEINLSRSGRY